jgi:hypothetical protein
MKHSFFVLLSAVAVCVFVSATPALAGTAPGAKGNGNGCMRAGGVVGRDRSCNRVGGHGQRHPEVALNLSRDASQADPPLGPKLGCLWGLKRYNGVSCRRAGPSSASY